MTLGPKSLSLNLAMNANSPESREMLLPKPEMMMSATPSGVWPMHPILYVSRGVERIGREEKWGREVDREERIE